jgi:hypothetical protein
VFAWALRDAVALAGHYRSPAEASAFYGKMADEIGAACETKQLECERQLFAELPPYTWAQLARVPQRALASLAMVLSARWQSADGVPSLGLVDQLLGDLRFLNFPFVARPEPTTRMFYALRGWTTARAEVGFR